MTGAALIDIIRSRPILLILIMLALGIVVYCVGAFYHQYINNPLDFASLLFIVAVYVGAIYHQVSGFEKK